MLALGCADGKTKLVDSASGETKWVAERARWNAHISNVSIYWSMINPVAMSPDGRFVAGIGPGILHDESMYSMYARASLRRWEPERWEASCKSMDKPLVREAETSFVCAETAQHDGSGMCICQEDEHGRLWVQPACPVKEHEEAITVVEFSPCGKMIATGDVKGWVILWNFTTTLKTATLEAKFRMDLPDLTDLEDAEYFTRVISLSFSADGARLIGMLDRVTVRVWDTKTGAMTECWEGGTWMQHPSTRMPQIMEEDRAFMVSSAQFWPGSSSLISLTCQGEKQTMERWDLDSGEQFGVGESELDVVGGLQGPLVFSIDGHKIAAVFQSSPPGLPWPHPKIAIYRYHRPEIFTHSCTITPAYFPITRRGTEEFQLSFSVDGSLISIALGDGDVVLIDTSTALLSRTIVAELRPAPRLGLQLKPSMAWGPDWVKAWLRGLAFAMGNHPRTGADSKVLILDSLLIQMILERV